MRNSVFTFIVSSLLSILASTAAFADAPGIAYVIHGSPVGSARYPWMVALLDSRVTSPRKGQFCGGALISSRHVLTAAHCIKALGLGRQGVIEALLGTNLLDGSGERIKTARVIPYPTFITSEFAPSAQENDIAVVELSRPTAISPVKISTNDEAYPTGLAATIIGWGENDPNDELGIFEDPIDLMEAEIPVVTASLCAQEYGDFNSNTQLCAGLPATSSFAGSGSCNGDSGGPLVTKNSQGEYELEGLVSFGGRPCGAKPSVFTRVAAFRGWIESRLVGPSRSIRRPRVIQRSLRCTGAVASARTCRLNVRASLDATSDSGSGRVIARFWGDGKYCTKRNPVQCQHSGSDGAITIQAKKVGKKLWRFLFPSSNAKGSTGGVNYEINSVEFRIRAFDEFGNASRVARFSFRPK